MKFLKKKEERFVLLLPSQCGGSTPRINPYREKQNVHVSYCSRMLHCYVNFPFPDNSSSQAKAKHAFAAFGNKGFAPTGPPFKTRASELDNLSKFLMVFVNPQKSPAVEVCTGRIAHVAETPLTRGYMRSACFKRGRKCL